MAVRSTALPVEVPATVTSAARTPRVAPVEITSVTIGPGARISTSVIKRKPANNCQFMRPLLRRTSLRHATAGVHL